MVGTGEITKTRKYMRHLDLLRRFPLKTIGWRNWVQKLLEVVKTPNKPNQKPKTQLSRTVRLVKSEQPSGSSAQEIDKRVLLECESTNVRTGRPVDSCVPVSVERVNKRQRRRRKRRRKSNKNGETCKWTTNRFVHSARGNRHWLQSVWIATCSCETSRELPCSRSREEDQESSSSRSTSSRSATK